MILAVDIGNTQTVVGLCDADRVVLHGRFSSRRDWTADEFAITIHQWLEQRADGLGAVTGVAICSVVPPLEHLVRDALTLLFPHMDVFSVSPGVRTGMPIRYENPKEVGADRIVNAVAAYDRVHGPLIVADFGTAITFDCVSADGAYLGGAISPGLHVSTEALVRNTAKLPRIDPEPPQHAIGRNTVESLQSGVFYGFVALVDGMIERLMAEMGDVTVFATGGWATTLGPHLKRIDIIDPWLTLKGLLILHGRNRAAQ